MIESLDFVLMTSAHSPWVWTTMARSLADSPTKPVDVHAAVEAVKRLARQPGSIALVAHPARHPDDFVGWVVASVDGSVGYVYVRDSVRRAGVGRHLLSMASQRAPIPFACWTRYASRMVASGFPIFHDSDWFAKLTKYKGKTHEG